MRVSLIYAPIALLLITTSACGPQVSIKHSTPAQKKPLMASYIKDSIYAVKVGAMGTQEIGVKFMVCRFRDSALIEIEMQNNTPYQMYSDREFTCSWSKDSTVLTLSCGKGIGADFNKLVKEKFLQPHGTIKMHKKLPVASLKTGALAFTSIFLVSVYSGTAPFQFKREMLGKNPLRAVYCSMTI